MAEARRPRRGHVRIYDFRRPYRFSKEQLRALYMVHEHVARLMAPTLAAFHRGPVQLGVRDVRQETFAEFLGSLPNPCCVAVLAMPPLEGRALLEVEGVAMVFLLNNFITVTRRPGADWDAIVPACLQAIQQQLGASP